MLWTCGRQVHTSQTHKCTRMRVIGSNPPYVSHSCVPKCFRERSISSLYYTACLCKLATSHTTHAINRYVCVRPSVLSTTTFQAKAARPRSPRWMATVWAESETDEEEEERTMNKIIQQYTQCSLLGGEGGGQDRSIVVVVGSGTGKFFFLFLLSSPYFPPTPLRT